MKSVKHWTRQIREKGGDEADRADSGGAQLAPKERPPMGRALVLLLLLLKWVLSSEVELEDIIDIDGCSEADEEAEASDSNSAGLADCSVTSESDDDESVEELGSETPPL